MVVRVLTVVVAFVASAPARGAAPVTLGQATFDAPERAEAVATISARCDACAWDVAGREAVVASISLDGRYVQHVPLTRTGLADYRLLIGAVEPGSHSLRVDLDPELTARDLNAAHVTIDRIAIEQIPETDAAHQAISLAPFIHARPGTVGRFTDVPLVMWYETEPSPRGTIYRYSVVFSNEDGGTSTDRLMATWGRTTDIEYLYSVEVDRNGAHLAEDMQGPDHKVLPFRGTREGRHPLLWVSTSNNMVLDEGTTRVRYAPAPMRFPLEHVSREAVMDAHPWTYMVMAQELAREGKIVADAAPKTDTIPDPRRFVYVEGCGELGGAALAFAVRAGEAWIPSDRGIQEYRIARDGCFRAAIPLPSAVGPRDIRGLRAQAYVRPADANAAPNATAAARLTRLNKVFMLDDHYRPGPSLLEWQGEIALVPGGPAVEIPMR